MAPPSRANGTCRRAPPSLRVQRHPVGDAVDVPGDDLRALAGVGRRQLLADEGVEQGGLARLHLAGDGDPQRLVEPPGELGDLGCAWRRARRSACAARVCSTPTGRRPASAALTHARCARSAANASSIDACGACTRRRSSASTSAMRCGALGVAPLGVGLGGGEGGGQRLLVLLGPLAGSGRGAGGGSARAGRRCPCGRRGPARRCTSGRRPWWCGGAGRATACGAPSPCGP